MPGPTKQTILELVRSSCQSVAAAHGEHIKIDAEAVQRVAGSLPVEDVKASVRATPFPLQFPDQASEITFMALYRLLDFGSGYDPLLLARNQRDAKETMQFGVVGMHLGGKRLDHHFMASFNAYSVHNFTGIQSHEEAEVPSLPGVTMSRPGPLQPLTVSIVQVMSETGEVLKDLDVKSLGDYVLSFVDDIKAKKLPPTAAALVEDLVSTFPAFADSALYDGSTVVYARKAQALAADLHSRFSPSDERFAFVDMDQLAADSGNVVPAVLRSMGVLTLSTDITDSVDAGEELPSGPHERALRAAAVAACDAVAAAAGGAFSAYELGQYLCLQAEKEAQGELHKHLTRGTVAY